ncbi:iron uptake porin [Rivularia sp. UHCC 0363]|uniref:iron uptake porin n=1 Tax=Rivularia sp. UHCC 0363 TaxID=3110244 RepID=UPI002B213787|nr:iron uptake porin [Rivularia sp. UHCC 0363]MEA5599104.1 iron uptake porin [Rivularia sp. UHCC 0363]
MSNNIVWKYLALGPAVFGATLLVSTTAIAASKTTDEVVSSEVAQAEKSDEAPSVFSASLDSQATETFAQAQQTEVNVLEEVTKYGSEGQENGSQSQVTSVSQFSDVQPTDWAFQALQSLVERYGCIAGYPNGTYRGNRALTRYEFAAGLNACLDRVNELIATATADIVTKEDLATLQRLQEEFSAELATLRGRVDALEARTAELESNQFSTTTKLAGEAIFALTDAFGDTVNSQNNTVFQNRIRLDLQTSFTGKDVLHTRLATGNAGRLNTGKDVDGDGIADDNGEGFQTFNLTGDPGNSNSVTLDWLSYYTNLGPAQLYVAATGGIHSDYAATVNPYFEDYDGGNGALTTFASESPIYRIGGGAGAALNIKFGAGNSVLRPSSLTIGYLGSEPSNPGLGSGIFNGNYAALGQLNFNVSNRIALAATYVHGYHGQGSNLFDAGGFAGTTTRNVNGQPTEGYLPVVGTTQANRLDSPSSSNSYGLAAAIRPSDKFSISGFVSYHDVTGFRSGDDFEAWSWGAGIALPDFGGKGNVLGFFGGAQPYSLNRNLVAGANDSSVPYQVEGFYKYRVNDNVSITPGVIYQTSSGQDSNSNDVFIGTLRTTFTF